MKQPELGIKLAELRKAKGLTQEELVDLCNISVRTIQRIETGEVMPRSYTVKTILAALGSEFEELSIEDTTTQPLPEKAEAAQREEREEGGQPAPLLSQLNLALVFGVVYFILGFVEAAADVARFDGEMVFGEKGYILLKLVVLVSFVCFQQGFVVLGQLYNNYLLKAAAMLLIAASVVLLGYDIVSLFFASAAREVVLMGAAITYGVIGLVFAVGLMRLQGVLGRVALLAGLCELAAAGFFLTVVLAPIGLMVQAPAELLEILLLFKTIGMMKAQKGEMRLA